MIALAKPDNLIALPQPQSKSNEWYTPSYIIDAARFVMGEIDLDPASCEIANQIVKASRYYSKEQNGLEQPWYGRVWVNPPFSASDVRRGIEPGRTQGSTTKLWIDHLISEYKQNHITEAILLVKSDMKASWFRVLWEFPICFAHDHLYFIRPGLPPEKHFFGTSFVYLGKNEHRFVEVFSKFGPVTKCISPLKTRFVNLSLWEVQS